MAAGAAFAISSHAGPQELPLEMSARTDIPDGSTVKSYPAAVDAIVRAMVHKFQLPAPHGKLLIYATREEFEQGLIEHLKIAPELAQSTARFGKSAVGNCNVLVNEPAVADSTWPVRIELLAHELAHSVQLTVANRCGLARHQWLLEGFAEWMAFNVTDALKLDDMTQVRARLAAKVRVLRRKDQLPGVMQLDSFAQWVAARHKYGFDGTYSFAFLVTDFLIERHSLRQIVEYFRGFERSSDHLANFRFAFGETPEEFGRALDLHLKELLG